MPSAYMSQVHFFPCLHYCPYSTTQQHVGTRVSSSYNVALRPVSAACNMRGQHCCILPQAATQAQRAAAHVLETRAAAAKLPQTCNGTCSKLCNTAWLLRGRVAGLPGWAVFVLILQSTRAIVAGCVWPCHRNFVACCTGRRPAEKLNIRPATNNV